MYDFFLQQLWSTGEVNRILYSFTVSLNTATSSYFELTGKRGGQQARVYKAKALLNKLDHIACSSRRVNKKKYSK